MGGDSTILVMWGFVLAVCGVMVLIYQLGSSYIERRHKEKDDGE